MVASTFVCWQDQFANEWVAVPAMTLIPIVGPPELPPPDAPGPFAFADRERVAGILESAGFSGVEFDDLQMPLLLGGGLDVDAAVEFLGRGGMGKRFLANADGETRDRALDAVREAFRAIRDPRRGAARLGSLGRSRDLLAVLA